MSKNKSPTSKPAEDNNRTGNVLIELAADSTEGLIPAHQAHQKNQIERSSSDDHQSTDVKTVRRAHVHALAQRTIIRQKSKSQNKNLISNNC